MPFKNSKQIYKVQSTKTHILVFEIIFLNPQMEF